MNKECSWQNMGISITRVASLKEDCDKKKRWEKSANDGKAVENKEQSGVEVKGTNQGTCTNKQQKKRMKTVHKKSTKLNQGSTGC